MDLGDRNTLLILAAVVFVVVVLGTAVLARIGDAIQAFTVTRKARKNLAESGYETVVQDIDQRIASMEANLEATNAQPAKMAGRSRSTSAAHEGVFNELRWLRMYREVVEREKDWGRSA